MKLAKALLRNANGEYIETLEYFRSVEDAENAIDDDETIFDWPLKINGVEQWVEWGERDLEPCIFCGGEVIILGGARGGFYVGCSDKETCASDGPRRKTKSEAIEAHNKIARRLKNEQK
jgi:hypothetical protein